MFGLFRSKPRRRPVAFPVCEALEPRCLLSAAMSGAAEVSEETHHNKHERKKTVVLPYLQGRFLMTTHSSSADVTGILDLKQRGKRITGTLTNEGQPPGKFRARILIAKATAVQMTGSVLNRSLDSKPVKFETDPFDPDEWPDSFDFPPEPLPEIEGEWEDPFGDSESPDFTIVPLPPDD